MKKLFFALLLAAVALTGCDKDETTDVVLRDVELKASIDLNASRVAFDQGGNFFWTVDDAIGVTTTSSILNSSTTQTRVEHSILYLTQIQLVHF